MLLTILSAIQIDFEELALPLVQTLFFAGFLSGLMFGLQFGLAIAYGRLRGLGWNELTAIYFFLPLGVCAATAASFLARLGYLALTEAPIVNSILQTDEWSMETYSILAQVYRPIAIASLVCFLIAFAGAFRLRRGAFFP